MKALGIAFSARKRGNCLCCVEYVLKKLEEKDFTTEIVNVYDYEIRPCSHCNYECFAKELRGKEEECPIRDDVPKIYEKMKKADIIVMAVPTYGGNVSGLYRAWTERGQAFFKTYEDFVQTVLTKTIALIVIGNVPAGGTLAYHTIVFDHYEAKIAPPAILLQSVEYGQSSLAGTLIEDPRVRARLDSFAELILKRWKRSREN